VSLKLINIGNGMAWLPTGEVPIQSAVEAFDSVVTYGQCGPVR